MNGIQVLAAQPWVERLGWTLLHFVWEGCIIAAIYAAARKGSADVSRPNVRYLLGCATLVLMALAPLATWTLLRPTAPQFAPVFLLAPLSSGAAPSVRDLPRIAPGEAPQVLSAPILSWVVAVWLAGAAGFALRIAAGWIGSERLRRQGVRAAPSEWTSAFRALKTRIRVSRPVRLLVSPLVQAPSVVGWLRPVVLIPVGALTGLPAEQVEALLLHELAHIRRHDYLVNAVQGLLEAVLFYHPAVWWISGQIRAERELCCDDLAISITGDVISYARALAEFASVPPRQLSPVAANGGYLRHRIARLLGECRPTPGAVSGPTAVFAVILVAIAGCAVFGQQPDRPQFEAASVKPSSDRGFMMVRPLPGRLTANASLRLLIQNAYAVQPFQIAGGPAWVDSERFEIDAKAGVNAGRAQLFLMLQTLLEERFQLRAHRESRELPVYALVAANSGLKLPWPKEGGCENPPPDAPVESAGGRMQPPGQGQPGLPRCGSLRVRLDPSGALIEGGKVPMTELTRTLSMVMGRAVVDKTGFSELFDVRLAFLPDQSSAALPPPPPDSAAALDPRFPSIVTALQEQLGLRVQSTKGPVEVVVIDHVERPSAN